MEDAEENMIPQAVPNYNMGDELPQRIEGCYRYLFYTIQLQESLEREMTERERATYDAALDCLKLYFLGETDHGSIPTKGVSDEVGSSGHELRRDDCESGSDDDA